MSFYNHLYRLCHVHMDTHALSRGHHSIIVVLVVCYLSRKNQTSPPKIFVWVISSEALLHKVSVITIQLEKPFKLSLLSLNDYHMTYTLKL